jgi:RND superfamily putative drug exporter
MVILPLPFIRSIGIGGMLIPAVSVLAAITLLPALLVAARAADQQLRVLPKRLVDAAIPRTARGALGELRRPPPVAGRAGRLGDRRRARSTACS